MKRAVVASAYPAPSPVRRRLTTKKPDLTLGTHVALPLESVELAMEPDAHSQEEHFGLPSDVREAEPFARATGSLSDQGVDVKQSVHCCLLLVLHRLLRPHMEPVDFSQGYAKRSPSER